MRTHFNILPQTVVIFLYFTNQGHLVHTKVHSFLCWWLCGKRSQIFSLPDQEAIQATQEYLLRMLIFCGEGWMLELY